MSWRGLRTVLSQNRPGVFIRHGPYHIKAHSFLVQRVNPKLHDNDTHKPVISNPEISSPQNHTDNNICYSDSNRHNEDGCSKSVEPGNDIFNGTKLSKFRSTFSVGQS